MQKIKILDPQEAIKIAAGEVVERPAHILKELVENSIDAQATEIIIHSKQSGKQLLSITDNGTGMSPEDAQLCFAHHATSKITTVQDLDAVVTYGFRGEALSSITSVAKVSITTKTADKKSATQIILQHGSIVSQEHVAHPTGTTIKVEQLFDHIPARKKFLKSNDTEWNAIISIFQAFCLRYPTIHFKLFHDEKLSYNCPNTNDTVQRCAQLWSNNLHDQLLTIPKVSKNDIKITGAISKPHYYRYNRNQMFIFVNNRWVKNIELSRAIIKGYQNTLPPQKYPAAFLFIEIDPTTIDINIHPKKEEIKFLHPGIIQKFIQETITQTLNETVTQTLESQPALKKTHTHDTLESSMTTFAQPHKQAMSNLFDTIAPSPFDTRSASRDNASQANNQPFESYTQEDLIHNNQQATPPEQKIETIEEKTIESNETIYEQEPFTVIGQFNNTYIVIEQNNQLILFDQHAAHERILYENFKKNFKEAATVQLLFPHIIKLTENDLSLINNHTKLFSQHGIVFEQFSDTELVVQATPVSLKHKDIDETIQMTLDWIKQHEHIDEQQFFKELNEQIHTQKACKAACKAGDVLNQEQMINIIQTLLTIEHRFSCPHGRPTMWDISLKEIEKQFKRDYKSQQDRSIN